MQTQQLAAVAPLHHRSPRALAPAGGCVLRRTAVRQLRGVALPCRVQVARRTRGSAATASLGAAGQLLPLPVCSFRMGDSTVTLETGRIGRQANGSVLAREGETAMLTTICAAEPSSDTSFLPLTVVYQERFSAAGTTSSGFVKREGKARDNEVLISRLVDRPLRPVFADGFYCETQVLQLLMAWGGTHAPDALAITAAGAAAAISDIPLSKPVAGVRVGWPRGAAAPIVNPSIEQMSDSLLDLVIAGTSDAILMIEGFCDFLTEEQMLVAVEAGHSAVRGACIAISEWAALVGKPKDLSSLVLPPAGLQQAVSHLALAGMEAAVCIGVKQDRAQALKAVNATVMEALSGQFAAADIKAALKEAQKQAMRTLLRKERLRSDGRGPSDVRQISSEAGLLPRVHGCCLFTRGETQAIAVVTLGGDSDAQRVDEVTGPHDKESSLRRFALHYFFPPFSVGEVGRVGAPSRRELGHGNLAERALLPTLPSRDEFPYTIRVESTITESNGSSSMASVCAGSLALQDAGVPVSRLVAGVAMGLVMPDAAGQEAIILTDILGSEDALGDMDFKVAGDRDGITAFQMDIKVEGITLDILRDALAAAKLGRIHILERMAAASPPPRGVMSALAPRVGRTRIDPAKAGMVIGAGGKNIRSICDATGATDIQIDDQGVVTITATSQAALEAALEIVRGTTVELEVGTIYRAVKVSSVTDFGAFVEVMPGKIGLLHISEMALTRVDAVSAVLKVGDEVDVKLLELSARGQMRLSRRAVLEADGGVADLTTPPPRPSTPEAPRREQRVFRTGGGGR